MKSGVLKLGPLKNIDSIVARARPKDQGIGGNWKLFHDEIIWT